MGSRQKDAECLIPSQNGHCDRPKSYMRVLHFKIESALTKRANVELTGAARLFRAATEGGDVDRRVMAVFRL